MTHSIAIQNFQLPNYNATRFERNNKKRCDGIWCVLNDTLMHEVITEQEAHRA